MNYGELFIVFATGICAGIFLVTSSVFMFILFAVFACTLLWWERENPRQENDNGDM